MKRIILTLLLAVSLLFTCSAFAHNVTVTGVGVTEAEATNDAMRNAVENTVGVLVESETLVEKYQVAEDKIFAHSRGFIKHYRVIESNKDADMWRVTIDAEIDTNPDSELMSLLEKEGLITVRLRNPRVAVLIQDRNTSYRIHGHAAETAATNAFIEAGFSNMIDVSKERIQYNNPFNLGAEDLHTLAASMQADILIVGDATCDYIGDAGKFLPGGKRTGALSYRAQVEAKMYVARTGQIIATDSKYGSGIDTAKAMASKKALEAAGKAIGEYMSGKLLELAAGNKQSMKVVVITSSFDKLANLEAALGSVKGVKNVNLSDYADGRATYSMNFGGSPQTLFTQLQNSFEGNMELRSTSYNILTIAVW